MAMWTVHRHPSINSAFAVVSDEGAWVEQGNPTTGQREIRPFVSPDQAWAHARALAREASPHGLERTVEVRIKG